MLIPARCASSLLFLAVGALLLCPVPAAAQGTPVSDAARPQAAARPVIEVTAIDYAFRAPDVAQPGWTTIRFTNDGEEPHFVYMSRLPGDRTLEDYEHDLSAPFSRAWDALLEGEVDRDGALGMVMEAMPAWYAELGIAGGPGLTAPGETIEFTMYLEPGTYVLECYIKTPDGQVHMMDGMLHPMVVAGTPATAQPPQPDIRVTLSNFEMQVTGDLTAGRRTIEVHVTENPEEGFGHSVHIARLEPGTGVDDIVGWMDWFDLSGLRTPAPARFFGGAHPMVAGSRAYLTLDLQPGRYAFVSEGTGALGVAREVVIR